LQVRAPLLGRGRGRFLKLSLPSLGGAGGDSSSWLSPPWEGRGWVLVFSFTNPSSGRALLENIK